MQNTYDFFLLKTAPTECIVNTKLSESNRASGVLRRSFLQCDQRNLKTLGKWHQFVGDAGTKMPNSCVPTQRCGTHAPGWMNGEHPKKEEGVVSRQVCFHWSNNCCRWKVTIKVRNCGGHYVYKLEKPPACYLRFCGDKGHSKFFIEGRDSGFQSKIETRFGIESMREVGCQGSRLRDWRILLWTLYIDRDANNFSRLSDSVGRKL